MKDVEVFGGVLIFFLFREVSCRNFVVVFNLLTMLKFDDQFVQF